MSAEDEKDLEGKAPAEPDAPKKRGLAKRLGKRDSAKDRAAAAEPAAKEAAAKESAAKEPTAEKSAAKEPSAKEPAASAAAKEPAAKESAAQKPAAEATAAAESAGKGSAAKGSAKGPAAKESGAKEPDAAQPAEKESAGKPPATAKRTPAGLAAPKTRSAARGAGAGGEAVRRRVVRARARYVRTSARKARMVCGHLRGKSVQEARAILAFTPRDVARDWSKLLESAVANAESNHELLEDDLIVREAYADEGPTIKRFRPRAMGRATPIRKRTSHLTITLTPGPSPTTKRTS